MKKFLLALVALIALPMGYALADGYFFGFPAAVPPLADTYSVPMDTHLSGGAPPQTATVTATQLKDYMFGGVAKCTATGSGATTASTATCNGGRGSVTSASMTTAAAATNTLTLTNSSITANSIILWSIANGTNTTPDISIEQATPGAGSATLLFKNNNAGALNGTIIWNFVVVN